MISNVTLVVCAAPIAIRAVDVVTAMQNSGYGVKVVLTPAAREWVDKDALERVSDQPAVSEFREPRQLKRRPAPDAVVGCPMTFNTVNKVAGGAMDNYALGVLCEAVALGTPLVSVPMVNNRLWQHPAWSSNLRTLADAGVIFVDPQTGKTGDPVAVQSGTGPEIVEKFDPAWVIEALPQ